MPMVYYSNEGASSIFKSYWSNQDYYNMIDKMLDLLNIAGLAL